MPTLVTRMLAAARLLLGVSLVLATTGTAAADDQAEADRLTIDGAKLAEAGRFDEAIASFRRAEALAPRAINDCNIGLAYARSDRPAHAHFFLRRCRARAPEALPSWVDARMQKLDAALRAGSFAPVDLVVTPAGATVTIASFLPDDLASVSSPVWLPSGAHDVIAARPGFVALTRSVAIDGKVPQTVRLELDAEPSAAAAAPAASARPDLVKPFSPPPQRRSPLVLAGAITGGVGVALAGAGVYFLLRARDGYDDVQGVIDVHGPWTEEDADTLDQAESDDRAGKVLLAVGGGVVVVGGVLLFLGIRADDRAAEHVTVAPTDGGAIAGVTCDF